MGKIGDYSAMLWLAIATLWLKAFKSYAVLPVIGIAVCMYSLTHSLIHSLAYLMSRPLISALDCLTYSPIYSLNHKFVLTFAYSLTHLFTRKAGEK